MIDPNEPLEDKLVRAEQAQKELPLTREAVKSLHDRTVDSLCDVTDPQEALRLAMKLAGLREIGSTLFGHVQDFQQAQQREEMNRDERD